MSSVLPDWFYDRLGKKRTTHRPPKRRPPARPPKRPPITPVDPVGPDYPDLPSGYGGDRIAACGEKMVAGGCPYVWASAGPCSAGFDCAGLTNFCVNQAVGRDIGRSGEHQLWNAGGQVVGTDGVLDLSVLKPGDILFWHTGVVHTGIYAGNGRMHNALNVNQGLATSTIVPSSYWGSGQAYYLGARRFG
jgi:hypothetical protein